MSRDFTPPPPGPMRMATILGTAVGLVRSRPGLLMGLALISVIPVQLVTAISTLWVGEPTTARDVLALVAPQLIVSVVVAPAANAAVAVAVLDMIHGRTPRASHALEVIGERFLPMTATALLVMVGTMLGMVALVIPGVIISVWWAFAAVVAVVESRAPVEAMRRSVSLARPAFWWVLGVFLVMTVLGMIALGAIGSLVLLPLGDEITVSQVVVQSIVEGALAMVAGAFVSAGVSLMYVTRVWHTDGRWPSPVTPAPGHEISPG